MAVDAVLDGERPDDLSGFRERGGGLQAGADKLCQTKGFKEGKSLNVDAAQTCSAKVLIPGRTRKPDDCRTDNYVTSALCQ